MSTWNITKANPLGDIKSAIKQPKIPHLNTIVLPRWYIDKLKEAYHFESDDDILVYIQAKIDYRIEKLICADDLKNYPDVKI